MPDINHELSNLFADMAFLMQLNEENPFKVRAIEKASDILGKMDEDVEQLAQKNRLLEVPGIGKGIGAHITEFLKTGKVKEYEELAKQFPATIFELQGISGLGPKKIKILYEKLEIKSLAELEYACNENRLLDLKGFGKKTQSTIMKSIATKKTQQGRVLLPVALALAEEIKQELEKDKNVKEVFFVGELRRTMETIQSLDFLLLGNIKNVTAILKSLKAKTIEWEQNSLWKKAHIELLASAQLENGLKINFFGLEKEVFLGGALVLLTGSNEFLTKLSFNERNLQQSDEKKFFHSIKTTWVPPELRETGEELGHDYADLIEVKDIRGVFHMHTTASDGIHSLEEMAEAALALGFEYIGISEHSKSAFYAHGLREEEILKQREQIRKLEQKIPLRIFHGIESDIHVDGDLDYDEKVLKEFDFVIASIHGQFHLPKEEMTRRVCRALENPYTTWLGHTTGRLLLGREPIAVDMGKVLLTAKKYNKSIELNANPYRLDLDWRFVRQAKAKKIPIGIFPDAHSKRGLEDIRYGVMIARKAGLTANDVCNTKSRKEMEAWLARNN